MLYLQGVAYQHQHGDLLFADINLSINKQDQIALIGNNGAGKSTLLKILANTLAPSSGLVKTDSRPYIVPQLFGQFNEYTIAEALQIADQLKALHEILEGEVTDENLTVLADDWGIEERCQAALAHWKLEGLQLTQKMESLSGGQKTKVFLAGIMIHHPAIVLLDEPSNHLDSIARKLLYNYIRSTKQTLVVVSHDRTLLNLLPIVYEIHKNGITVYGGNYEFYLEQKTTESEALSQEVRHKEKALRKAKEIERAALARQQKLDARGKKKQEQAGLPTISMNTLKNKAEQSTSRMKDVHTEKVGAISQELRQLRSALPDLDQMKMNFDHATLPKGKVLLTAKDLNFAYGHQLLWQQPLNFQIKSGERVVIKGANGTGKTTLIQLLLRQLAPKLGSLQRATGQAISIDQDYSLIDRRLKVYEQAQHYNTGALQEHEVKIRLNRFLFTKADWDKPCAALSGGEQMRLILCCLTISNQAPDLMILDEPTNNLDIQNIRILTAAINEYQGTLIVVSHDAYFLKQINVEKEIILESGATQLI